MRWWETIGSVLAGTVVTVVLGGTSLVSLPLLGLATVEVVGDGLPMWVFAGPVVVAVAAGGLTTGFLQWRDRRRGVVLGGLAGTLLGAGGGVAGQYVRQRVS